MTRRSKWLLLTAVTLAVLGSAVVSLIRSRHSPRIIYDYASGADGRVVDIAGRPIPDATVILMFDQTVFEAITPRRSTRVMTDQLGRFEASLISCGHPGGGYTVIVQKSGYRSARVRGSGVGFHRIVLAPASSASASL